MKVTDTIPSNAGALNSWSLEVCGRPLEARPPEIVLKSVTKSAANAVVLDWWPYPGLTSYKVYRAASAVSASGFSNVTAADANPSDTRFEDSSPGALSFYIMTGVNARGESPWGHYGQ
jgi:hypothetical protein